MKAFSRRLGYALLLAGLVGVTVIAALIFREPDPQRNVLGATGWKQPAPSRPAVPHPDGIGWRGDDSGRYPNATPPVHWSATDHVVWKTPLPGRSNATPVPLGDRIFVTAEPDLLVALRASDGAILWQRPIRLVDALEGAARLEVERILRDAPGLEAKVRETTAALADLKRLRRQGTPPPNSAAQRQALDESLISLQQSIIRIRPIVGAPENSYLGNLSSTPVTDGRWVYVLSSTGVVAAFDLEGNRRWIRRVPNEQVGGSGDEENGVGASLIFAANRLIVPLRNGLHGLDADTGAIVWSENEALSWGSPLRVNAGGTDLLVMPTGDVRRATDGRMLDEGDQRPLFTGPTSLGRTVLFTSTTTGPQTLRAVEIPDDDTQPFALKSLWDLPMPGSEFRGMPLAASSGLWFGFDPVARKLLIVDLATGQLREKHPVEIRGDGVPSLAMAGRYLYVFSETGEASVVDPQPPFAEVARNPLGSNDLMRASPVFAGSRMYLRTHGFLYCISESP